MKTILLVDDNIEYLELMELNLPEGCQVLRAQTLTDAQRIVSEVGPALAVLDVRLDDDDINNRDGLELLKWMDKHQKGTKVVVISAYHEFEYEAEALALGAERFLRKPIRPDEFREAVANLLNCL